MKPLVYVLEDDVYLASAIAADLRDLGCKVEALRDAKSLRFKKGATPTLVISDFYVPSGSKGKLVRGQRHSGNGIEALRTARQKWPKTHLVLMTGMPSSDAQKWCGENGVAYHVKPMTRGALERHLRLRRLRAFVVHGRNNAHRKKAVNALKEARIDPVVLMLQPNRGHTVIEKFEAIADTCDAAVAVWSPDDFGKLATGTSGKNRARQNVVFELGYFYGALRRLSGRVVLLEFGDTELPSDIAGVVRIDATRPLKEVVRELRREFENLLD